MKNLYTARASSTAGREGHTETDDGKISLDLTKPGGAGTNPEQLFAAGYSACFGSAVQAVAKKEGENITDVKVSAEIALNQDEEGGFFLAAVLDVSMAGVEDSVAMDIVEKAHQMCPYSKATRGNIDVTLRVNDRPVEAKAA